MSDTTINKHKMFRQTDKVSSAYILQQSISKL